MPSDVNVIAVGNLRAACIAKAFRQFFFFFWGMQLAELDVCCTLILHNKHITYKHFRPCSKSATGSLFNPPMADWRAKNERASDLCESPDKQPFCWRQKKNNKKNNSLTG